MERHVSERFGKLERHRNAVFTFHGGENGGLFSDKDRNRALIDDRFAVLDAHRRGVSAVGKRFGDSNALPDAVLCDSFIGRSKAPGGISRHLLCFGVRLVVFIPHRIFRHQRKRLAENFAVLRRKQQTSAAFKTQIEVDICADLACAGGIFRAHIEARIIIPLAIGFGNVKRKLGLIGGKLDLVVSERNGPRFDRCAAAILDRPDKTDGLVGKIGLYDRFGGRFRDRRVGLYGEIRRSSRRIVPPKRRRSKDGFFSPLSTENRKPRRKSPPKGRENSILRFFRCNGQIRSPPDGRGQNRRSRR